MATYTLKDFKSDQEVRWCAGCGDYSVLAALQRTLPKVCEEKGIDKEKVGQFASEIRGKRAPEPYKGKGIKYKEEHIRRKVGKTGKK